MPNDKPPSGATPSPVDLEAIRKRFFVQSDRIYIDALISEVERVRTELRHQIALTNQNASAAVIRDEELGKALAEVDRLRSLLAQQNASDCWRVLIEAAVRESVASQPTEGGVTPRVLLELEAGDGNQHTIEAQVPPTGEERRSTTSPNGRTDRKCSGEAAGGTTDRTERLIAILDQLRLAIENEAELSLEGVDPKLAARSDGREHLIRLTAFDAGHLCAAETIIIAAIDPDDQRLSEYHDRHAKRRLLAVVRES